MKVRRVLSHRVVAVGLVFALAACGGSSGGGDSTESVATEAPAGGTDATEAPAVTDAPTTEPSPGAGVLNVPDDYPTIQDAVDSAVEGDLILVAPGVYNEAVKVETPNIVIRGLDRNETILDGNFELDNGILVAGAGGVAIENLTARNYTKNGFYWTGVTGYRGSYLTALRNGDYGVYAFDSVGGVIEYSYAAGSPDAGFYIGQCYPCDALIRNVISEYNGLGYSGTNSGGNLLIIDSIFRFNRAGVVPNSGSYELCYPERESTIVGNLVYSNNQPDTPAIDVAILAMGNGILSAGGVKNVIERNRVWDHDKTGIGLVPFLEETPNDDMPTEDEWSMSCDEQKNEMPVVPEGALLWDSMYNEVRDNVLEDNRSGDIAVASAGTEISTLGNCFSGNTFTLAAPAALEDVASCDAAIDTAGDWTTGALDVVTWLVEAETRPPSVPYKDAVYPDAGPQENMPEAATAPAVPAGATPPAVDLASIVVPDKID